MSCFFPAPGGFLFHRARRILFCRDKREWGAHQPWSTTGKYRSQAGVSGFLVFSRLAEETRIPNSRLLDEAIEDLLKKYEKKNG